MPRRLDPLVEPQRDDNASVEPVAAAIPGGFEQPDCGGRKGEGDRASQLPSTCRSGPGGNSDLIFRGLCERTLRVRREDQDGRAGPPERAGRCGTDRDKRRRHSRRDPAEHHHRFREHDANLAGFGERRDFAGGPALDDRQAGFTAAGLGTCRTEAPAHTTTRKANSKMRFMM